MTEAERAEALGILQGIHARLDEMSAMMRDIQRSITMIELRCGIMIACMDAREAARRDGRAE